jgi:hypothetical protein
VVRLRLAGQCRHRLFVLRRAKVGTAVDGIAELLRKRRERGGVFDLSLRRLRQLPAERAVV